MQLYRLVYCVGCAVPVYWVGLGERVGVEKIRLWKPAAELAMASNKKSGAKKDGDRYEEYLVFKCDVCEEKSRDRRRMAKQLHQSGDQDLNEQPDESKYCCIECRQPGGLLRKISFEEGVLVNDQIVKEAFVHPVCAMAFPNLYQWKSPESMEIRLC